MSGTNDETEYLIAAMRNGCTTAFEQFYERFVPLVFKIAYRMTGNTMEAEDICHDIFLEVFYKIGQYDAARGSVEAWLAVRTKSRCLDRLKQKQRLQLSGWDTSEGAVSSSFASPEESVMSKLTQETVLTAIRRIPEEQRKALYGMYFEAQTMQQLSRKMNRPLGTIKSCVRYGLNNLRKQLRQLGWMEPAGGRYRFRQ